MRGGSHLRRGRGVRRASARASLTRIGAVLVLLGSGLALARFSDAAAFMAARVSIEGATLTDRATVESALLGGTRGGSVFRYDTAAAADRLGHLPAVRRADVRAVLPDLLAVTLEERTPVLLWVIGDGPTGFLVDDAGLILATADASEATVAIVHDSRLASEGLVVGGRLAPVDLQVARRLAGLTPAMLAGGAEALVVSVDDEDGFVVSAEPAGWRAVFGPYADVTRGADLVPLQVQCLASLLASGPAEGVGRIVLSPEGQLCGTYSAPGGP
jgi:hypothetical protein